jgi:CpXC protein
LRYVVLAGLLNVAICPYCGRRAEMPIPFLYSDPAYKLLAYVHPNPDTPEEARLLILEQLRATYHKLVSARDKDSAQGGGLAIALSTDEAHTMPSLKVLFGLDQLVDVINADLEPEERMGKLALNTQSRDEAERNQFLTITRKLATEMGCCIDVEDLPDEYTLWLYGPRRQIGALMRVLTPRG